MERQFVDPAELELRRDPDFLRAKNMIDEGAPVHGALKECENLVRKLESIENSHGYEGPSAPRSCEL